MSVDHADRQSLKDRVDVIANMGQSPQLTVHLVRESWLT